MVVKPKMKLPWIPLASVVACAALASPAHAQTGNGLYEPFPSPSGIGRAQEFIGTLPGASRLVELDPVRLKRGVFVGHAGLAAYTNGHLPAERARSGAGFDPSLGWPLGLLLVVAVGGAATLVVRRT